MEPRRTPTPTPTRAAGRAAAPRWHTSGPVVWATVGICALIAGAAAHAAATGSGDRTGAAAYAVAMGGVALLLANARRPRRLRWTATTLEGRPAWALRLGAPGAAVLLAVVCTGLGAVLGVPVARDPGPGTLVVLGPPVLLMAAVALEAWRIGLVRRPRLVVSADLLVLRGTGLDARLDWDDVGSVEHTHAGSRWAAVQAVAVRDAPSYAARRRRLLLPTDRVPDPPGVPVRARLVAEPEALLGALRELHVAGSGGREARLGAGPPEAPTVFAWP